MDSTASAPLFGSIGVALLGMAMLTGCACGNHGTLVARRTVVSGAEIVDVFAFGALLRPLGFDAGLTFGYRHASYIFPVASETADDLRPSVQWHWFRAPSVPSPPLLRAITTLGIEAQLTSEIQRCTIGYLEQVLTVAGSPTESKIVKLRYKRRHPVETTLAYHAD